MITSGGVRLAGEYVFKQDRMSENWYVVHTQPRGEKMLKALLDREPAVADTYLPMRQQFAIVGGQRVSRMALTMPGLVFVRGSKNQLVALLREKSGASRLMVDSSRKEKDAMVVADSEMTAFRLFNDNTAGQLMMLRSPFCNFTSADRKRIDSIVDNAPLRRFLTPTAETGTLMHKGFVEHRLPVALGDDRFTAHVAEHPDHSTAACWGEFATEICALAPSQRTALIDKLQRYGLMAFASAVEGSGHTRFEGAMLTSATLAPEALAAEGAAIIGEILASVRARRWRTLLYAVCLR